MTTTILLTDEQVSSAVAGAVALVLTASQLTSIRAQNPAAPPPPPAPSGDHRGLKIDGMPVRVFECSVDPQRTVLGDAKGVVFAIHCTTPEQLDPGYSGAFRGVYPNQVTFSEYGGGQRNSRQTAVVKNLTDTPMWSKHDSSNVTALFPGCYVLCKLPRQISSGINLTTQVKLYRLT